MLSFDGWFAWRILLSNKRHPTTPPARMGINAVDLYLYCETDVDVIIDQAREGCFVFFFGTGNVLFLQ